MAWKIGAGMRLDRDAVCRPQGVEIERRHDGGERGRRRLVAADLQAVGILAQMIGVMDGPAREPEHLALELGEDRQVVRAAQNDAIIARNWRLPAHSNSTVSKSAGRMISRSSQSSE